jgi:hypothetical protein
MEERIIITATSLVSTLGAHAAAQKAPHHPTHRQAKSTSACIAEQRPTADLFARLGNLKAANEWRTECMPVNKSAPPPCNNDPYIPGLCD